MSEGFFDRWSRRKQQVRAGEVPEEPEPKPEAPAASTAPVSVQAAQEAAPPVDLPPEPPPLTLADAEALTIDSDFRPFVASGVAPEVKNAAFKKLFADPHFNVMDGLDTYIDDYSKPSPLPESVLRQMASAKFLNLFDEEPEKPEETPRDDGLPGVAQSSNPEPPPSPPVADAQPASQEPDDHHADLRLQQDDAPRAEDARDGTG
ncbi:DUF3306 domain-containing protein [Variovorax sp. J2P1-59]|uniref:DUF3306 domain-containing protein n=1 Tax=Variovorax flavidus TaxID=3053501 RepID=UPI0025768C15|nr:DUF3306 domain-containing protein [Variovorax sp. J2P1-59]MDM0076848.1 DUF3306 domain-containing protein [Variovorax sp. J2P1-59]